MSRSSRFVRLALCAVSILALGVATGCGTKVEGGSDGGGGSGGAGGGDSEGGAAACHGVFTGSGCTPGDTKPCSVIDDGGQSYDGHSTCEILQGCETTWNYGCNTPLVLSFDGAPVDFVADATHGFDLNGGASLVTDWPTARTPWLALDRDGNGSIDDGSELFGSMSPLAGGGRAPNGFVALRELDENGDGRITAEDPAFARLLVWSDRDGDRRSSPAEIATAAGVELIAIDLGYTVAPRCNARGDCEVERASFTYRDVAGVVRTGAVVDVHFMPQP